MLGAQNPVDWKQLDNDIGIPSLPWTNGGDIAGTVYKVGPGVPDVQVGDRVRGPAYMRSCRACS